MRIYTADHILPISSPPFTNGAVAVDADLIKAVGEASDILAQYPGAECIDLGRAAILPGLVNCHSHLEITAMRGALDEVEHDFRRWLLRLNDIRRALSDDDIRAGALAGAVEGARAGVT